MSENRFYTGPQGLREALGASIASLRRDWYNLAEQVKLGMYCQDTLHLVSFMKNDDEQAAWKHGIHPRVEAYGGDHYIVAQRFVVSNAEFTTPLNTKTKRLPRLVLENKNGVLDVVLPGTSAAPSLRSGLALITNAEGRGLFVLSDTGRIVGSEDCGVEEIWQGILSCGTNGHRSSQII